MNCPFDPSPAHSVDGPKIRLENISHRYGEQVVLAGIDFEVRPREVVALLGPSGCGKSTLIRVLAGLLPVSQPGQRRLGASPDAVEIGLCFQEPRLLPWRTCVQNVALPLEATRMDRAKARALAQETLALVGMGDAMHRFGHELSGGMKMRVAVARALVKTPSVLLLDEPFAALDAPSRFELQNFLHQLRLDKGLSVVLVTHSLQEAARLADRACVMANAPGRIMAEISFNQGPDQRMDTRKPAFAQALIALQRGMQDAMEASK